MKIVAYQAFVDIWTAYDADSYDGAEDSNCPTGIGIGRDAAINDLVAQIEGRAYEHGFKDGEKSLQPTLAATRQQAVQAQLAYAMRAA